MYLKNEWLCKCQGLNYLQEKASRPLFWLGPLPSCLDIDINHMIKNMCVPDENQSGSSVSFFSYLLFYVGSVH